ncbi:MAG: valine--tRNA ligase [Nitriliruptorales bacterium]|nr:valine--tRNA ligase [Nitriliruptorales bacterium]
MSSMQTPSLPPTYDAQEVEERLYAWWLERGFFHAEPDDPGEPFVIILPPPNVTGSLHIGHALVASIEDAMIRHARMTGRNAVWVPGMDHAGIATQTVVERLLAQEGKTRHDLGREAFVERVWAFKEESGGAILRQHHKLGASLDWDREAFTFDEQRSAAVRKVFCDWYEQGLIYRGYRLINWDPQAMTALSDIEVEHETVRGELAHVRYPTLDGGEGVVVATTRTETMLGDTAVAVHPEDQRYAHMVGTMLRLPLIGREIPVIADEHVDPEFGTGAVKVTPAHDPNDYEIGLRHDLPMVDIMNDDATINANGGPYAGLDRFEARQRVKEDLDRLGLLVSVEPYEHSIGHSSRSKAVIEPRLSEQWFVKVRPLAERAAAAVREGRTRFIPERNAKGFLDWLDNLHDWCISRQLWWGHQIPAWYGRDGAIHVLREDPSPEEIERLGLQRDPDVLDAWFSSQLWPFTTLGWPEETPELRAWYPNTVLETGYDINTFWVSRMLMAGLSFMDDVPFRIVFNHGMVRDGQGKKMSKSFGNVIDPMVFIDAYGADALRFALLRAANPGQDAPLAEEWVEGARRFANKLWNAARFVLQILGGRVPERPEGVALTLEDHWILSRLEASRAEVDEAMTEWDLGRVARLAYHFVWDEYCDWYLEMAKLRTGAMAAGADADAARWTLAHVLDQALRLLHPLMPFVTEEIWRTLHDADEDATIMRAAWPEPAPTHRHAGTEDQFAAVQQAVVALRRFRAAHQLFPAARLTVIAVAGPGRQRVLSAGVAGIQRLAGVDSWTFADAAPSQGALGRIMLDGVELFVPLAGLIDLDEERARLVKERERADNEVTRARRKLGNAQFVAKAPAEVVQAERDKLAQWEQVRATLASQLDLLG